MPFLINSSVSGGEGRWRTNGGTALDAKGPARSAGRTNSDYSNLEDPNYDTRGATELDADIRARAVGLKRWTHLGMMLSDSKGRIKVDDPRFDPVFEMCAKYKIPVLIHTGDPWGLFQPMDRTNERWLELKLRAKRNQSEQTNFTWEQ